MKPLIIVGDSSFAEIAYEYFKKAGFEIKAFLVHREYITKGELFGIPIHPLEEVQTLFPPSQFDAFVALTYRELNRARARLCNEMSNHGYHLVSYVSPNAYVADSAVIGKNCFIFENNVIQSFVKIGDDVILWSGNHIGHHTVIEDHVFIASHVVISGHCFIGHHAFLGVNATLGNNITIGQENWIGPSCLIMKNTEAGQMYRVDPSKPSPISAYRFFKISDDSV